MTRTPNWVLAGAAALGLLLGGGAVPVAQPGNTGGEPLLGIPVRVAHAGEDMCEGDPIMQINGQLVQMVVSVPATVVPYLSGAKPVDITMFIPKKSSSTDLSGALVSATSGDASAQAFLQAILGPVPERVSFVSTKKSVSAKVANISFSVAAPPVPGRSSYPVVVTVRSISDAMSVSGTSAAPVTGAIKIPWV